MREVGPRFDVVLRKKVLVRGDCGADARGRPHFDAVLRKRASLCGDCDLDSNKEAVGSFLPTAFSIGVTGFEPATSWSQTTRATELRHTPKSRIILSHFFTPAQEGIAKWS